MFFPVGVVVQYANGTVLAVLDAECRHDIQCSLTCDSPQSWTLFMKKIRAVLLPSTRKYFLSLHSLSMCDAEIGRCSINKRGVVAWENKYAFT